jgi:hypothetical protein
MAHGPHNHATLSLTDISVGVLSWKSAAGPFAGPGDRDDPHNLTSRRLLSPSQPGGRGPFCFLPESAEAARIPRMILYHVRAVDADFGEPIRCPLGA